MVDFLCKNKEYAANPIHIHYICSHTKKSEQKWTKINTFWKNVNPLS